MMEGGSAASANAAGLYIATDGDVCARRNLRCAFALYRVAALQGTSPLRSLSPPAAAWSTIASAAAMLRPRTQSSRRGRSQRPSATPRARPRNVHSKDDGCMSSQEDGGDQEKIREH
jgi:hypothetical protein